MDFPVGSRVRARGETWNIEARTPFADCEAFKLQGASASNSRARRTLLVPFDRLTTMATAGTIRVLGSRAWARRVLHHVASNVAFGGLTATAAARIELLP